MIHLVVPSDARAARNLEAVAQARYGDDLSRLTLYGIALDPASERDLQEFEHTPEPLLDSWVAHRKLMAATSPGDTVVMSDWRGLGGVFALTQWSLPEDRRRTVVTVAADSACLTMLHVAGTIDDLPMPLASQIDWEVTQYTWSHEVLTPSPLALDLLAGIGVEHGSLVAPEPEASSPVTGSSLVWAPDPVSRRSRTGDVLRAVTSVPGAQAVVSTVDEDDGVWTGTTWDALRHVRAVLDSRVSRGDAPDRPSVIVIGDPFSVPDPEVSRMVAEGVPVVVPAGSAAAERWPGAPAWSDSDGVAAALQGETKASPARQERPASHRSPSPGRASRISVGIPVFRDVRFLAECLDSVLAQEAEPAEIVIVDDGSESPEVDSALEEAARRDPRVKVIRAEHRGVCVARNAALEAMTGDAFLFVDSDDVLDPAFLARCQEMLRSDDRLMAVATWTRFFGAYEGIEAKPPFDARVGARENPIVSTAALVDMRARDLGIRFAPELAFLYCEDWHLWSQIVAAGGRFGLVPEPLVGHRVHPSSGGFLRTELAQAIGRARATAPLRR